MPNHAVVSLVLVCCSFLPANAQVLRLAMHKGHLPFDRMNVSSMAVGDIDGDGDADVVVGEFTISGGESNLHFYFNDGRGRFDLVSQRPSDVTSVALGDVDGDGDLDLATDDTLFVNDGTGKFRAVVGCLPGVPGIRVTFGDFDGDGDLDLLRGSALLLNDGAGCFTLTSNPDLQNFACWYDALPVDVDGDGDLDLIGACAELRVFVNDGAASFIYDPSRMPSGYEGDRNALAAADIDGDGDVDVCAGTHGRNQVLRNDGTGHFTAENLAITETRAAVLADFDGDGSPDLVLGIGSRTSGQPNLFLRNDGNGRFTVTDWLWGQVDRTHALAAADFDGDGDNDLFVGNYSDQNRLYLWSQGVRFVEGALRVLPATRAFGLATCMRATGDFDRDGAPDVLAANGTDTQVHLNDGTGYFPLDAPGRFSVRLGAVDAATGDVDGDGYVDAVLARSPDLALLLNDRTGRLVDKTAGRLPSSASRSARRVLLGDVDGDGDPDLLVANGIRTFPDEVLINDGAGSFTVGPLLGLDETNDAAFGDVDGDGDLDIVTANRWGRNRLYSNDGTGGFAEVTATSLPETSARATAVILFDADGDADLDLVAGSDKGPWPQGPSDRLYLNDGSGVFHPAPYPTNIRATESLAVGDFDDDGDLDIVAGDDTLRPYRNDGAGHFAEDPDLLPAAIRWGRVSELAAIDIDGDEDIDLLATYESEQTDVYFNSRRQLSVPYLPVLGGSHRLEFVWRPVSAPGPAVALPVLQLDLGPRPTPLPGLGTFFLSPHASIPLPWVSLPQPGGEGVLELAVPLDPLLMGRAVYTQALVLQVSPPTGDMHLTGFRADRLMR